MTTSPRLSDQVAAAPAGNFLPERLRSTGLALPDRLRLAASVELGHGIHVLVLDDAAGRVICAPTLVDTEPMRARAGQGASAALVALLADEARHHIGEFELVRLGAHEVRLVGERAMAVDQTHESVVVGETAVVKWMVETAASPALDIVSHLAAVGFGRMPKPWGFLCWHSPERTLVLASVTSYLVDALDGWSWCVDDVTAFVAGRMSMTDCLEPVSQLAELTADLHAALATSSPIVERPVQQASMIDTRLWSSRAVSLLGEATRVSSGEPGRQLAARVQRMSDVMEQTARIAHTPVMRVHGDLHVGQVLRGPMGYAINDFDGNPVLSVTERQEPQPAARDVAGMLQSLDHVGRIVTHRKGGVMAESVDAWILTAQAAFMGTYRVGLQDRGILDLLDERLLLAFQVEQECREVIFAERHLPRWRYVPDAAMQSLFP